MKRQKTVYHAENEDKLEAGSHEELMYTLGVNLARQLGDIRPLIETGEELKLVARGLVDTVVGHLPDEEQMILIAKRGKDVNTLIAARADAIRIQLEATGRSMLQEMKETEGTTPLDGGVILHVLEANPDGQRPTKGSTVKVAYHGTLADGTVFDTTMNEEPVTFALGQVIPGWRTALLKMHEGETAMVGIPPEEAYGPEGTPDGLIPGGSTLFFKVQLIQVMTAAIGGAPTLFGGDGLKLSKGEKSMGLLGADGKPMIK